MAPSQAARRAARSARPRPRRPGPGMRDVQVDRRRDADEIDASLVALGLPPSFEVDWSSSTSPKCSMTSRASVTPAPRRPGPSCSTASAVRSAKPRAAPAASWAASAVVPLSRRWTRMTLESGELVATGDVAADPRPVVDEQLQVESWRQTARLARAGGGDLDAAQSTAERVVGGRQGIDQERRRRRAHPRRTGRPHHPPAWPAGTVARAGRRRSPGGRRRWSARAPARRGRGRRCSP